VSGFFELLGAAGLLFTRIRHAALSLSLTPCIGLFGAVLKPRLPMDSGVSGNDSWALLLGRFGNAQTNKPECPSLRPSNHAGRPAFPQPGRMPVTGSPMALSTAATLEDANQTRGMIGRVTLTAANDLDRRPHGRCRRLADLSSPKAFEARP
jgi:hypothetical protein